MGNVYTACRRRAYSVSGVTAARKENKETQTAWSGSCFLCYQHQTRLEGTLPHKCRRHGTVWGTPRTRRQNTVAPSTPEAEVIHFGSPPDFHERLYGDPDFGGFPPDSELETGFETDSQSSDTVGAYTTSWLALWPEGSRVGESRSPRCARTWASAMEGSPAEWAMQASIASPEVARGLTSMACSPLPESIASSPNAPMYPAR